MHLSSKASIVATLSVALIALAVTGCANIPAYKQEHVSKAGMTFGDSLVANANSRLNAQVEPGSSESGGAQASGCTACR